VTHNVQTLKTKARVLRKHNTNCWKRTNPQGQHCIIRQQSLSYLLPFLYYSCPHSSSVHSRPNTANSTHESPHQQHVPIHQSNVRRITLPCSHMTHSITSEYVNAWILSTKHAPVRPYQVLKYVYIMLFGTSFLSRTQKQPFVCSCFFCLPTSTFKQKTVTTTVICSI